RPERGAHAHLRRALGSVEEGDRYEGARGRAALADEVSLLDAAAARSAPSARGILRADDVVVRGARDETARIAEARARDAGRDPARGRRREARGRRAVDVVEGLRGPAGL